jgi:hypothetical protein
MATPERTDTRALRGWAASEHRCIVDDDDTYAVRIDARMRLSAPARMTVVGRPSWTEAARA